MHYSAKKTIALSIFFLFGVALVAEGSIASSVQKGNDQFEQGNFAESIQYYEEAVEENPENDIINFNLGTAYYKNGEFIKARKNLFTSLLSEDDELKLKAHYNLGNTFYQLGRNKETENIQLAIKEMESSITHYDEAISINAEDDDAIANKEFVQAEIKRLKELLQEQEQQKQSQDQQEQQEQDQENEEQSNEKQNSQSQESSQGDQDSSSEESEQQQSTEEQQESTDSSNASEQPSESSEEQDSEQNSPSAEQIAAGEITEQEADMLLDKFEQSEEHKGLINFSTQSQSSTPVLKDW